MVDPIDDIIRQARQGSISAIIQVLNEKLATSGVRTRAVYSQGVLQLLCEAPTPEQLEQTMLVDQVKRILESLRPRNIRKVNINSRIVREQQLLWLEDISRDLTGNQLLWSQQIVLSGVNPLKRLAEDLFTDRPQPSQPLPKRSKSGGKEFWRGMLIGGAGLGLLALLGWVLADRMGLNPAGETMQAVNSPTASPTASPIPASAASPVASPIPAPAQPAATNADPFAQAVSIAERAVADGKTASTAADWLDLATRWQRASDLMAQVDANDGRFKLAQDRTRLYGQNSQAAQAQADRIRQAEN